MDVLARQLKADQSGGGPIAVAPSRPDPSAQIVSHIACWLRLNFPSARGLILSCDEGGRHALVRGAVRMPANWVGQVLAGRSALKFGPDSPMLVRHAGRGVLAALSGRKLPAGMRRFHQSWLPLGAPAGTVNAVIVFTPEDARAWTLVRRRLRHSQSLLRLLAAAQLPQPFDAHPAIMAKQQWEATVDVLPEIICLLDGDRRVRRINRTIERWGLGNVRDSVGCELHGLLHPNCSGRGCRLQRALRDGWDQAAGTGRTSEVQFHDRDLQRTLNISLRHLTQRPGFAGADATVQAVCLVADVTALCAAREALQSLNGQLEGRVRARTEELTRANDELRDQILRCEIAEGRLRESRNELSTLTVQLMHAQENERKSISRELHDAVGQSLSAIKYTLERSVHLLDHPDRGNLADALELAVAHVHRTINDVRTISSSLRPRLLDDLGPVSAVRAFCREWSDVYPSVRLAVDMPLRDADVPRVLGISVFRVVQEALNNVAKHAAAKAVTVSLAIRRGKLTVQVADDGIGFDLKSKRGLRNRGSGWRGMRERAEHDGGKLTIDSAPGRGTTLAVCWPVVGA